MYQTRLKTTQLGETGLEITRVGFGAWAIGGGGWEFGWGPQDDEESIAAIHRALELGVNWIDTAAAYGFGHSEQIVGRALAGPQRAAVRVHEGLAARGPGPHGRAQPQARLDPARGRGEPRAARCRRDRPLPDPLADPGAGHRGGLVRARRAEGAGPRPPHRRLQLRRRAAASGSSRSLRSRRCSRSTR